jgi:hypothetical protein
VALLPFGTVACFLPLWFKQIIFAVTVKFDCNMNSNSFHLTNLYGPSTSAEKFGFITWLLNLDRTDYNDWIMAGDFNLYRSPEDRNKPGGNVIEM